MLQSTAVTRSPPTDCPSPSYNFDGINDDTTELSSIEILATTAAAHGTTTAAAHGTATAAAHGTTSGVMSAAKQNTNDSYNDARSDDVISDEADGNLLAEGKRKYSDKICCDGNEPTTTHVRPSLQRRSVDDSAANWNPPMQRSNGLSGTAFPAYFLGMMLNYLPGRIAVRWSMTCRRNWVLSHGQGEIDAAVIDAYWAKAIALAPVFLFSSEVLPPTTEPIVVADAPYNPTARPAGERSFFQLYCDVGRHYSLLKPCFSLDRTYHFADETWERVSDERLASAVYSRAGAAVFASEQCAVRLTDVAFYKRSLTKSKVSSNAATAADRHRKRTKRRVPPRPRGGFRDFAMMSTASRFSAALLSSPSSNRSDTLNSPVDGTACPDSPASNSDGRSSSMTTTPMSGQSSPSCIMKGSSRLDYLLRNAANGCGTTEFPYSTVQQVSFKQSFEGIKDFLFLTWRGWKSTYCAQHGQFRVALRAVLSDLIIHLHVTEGCVPATSVTGTTTTTGTTAATGTSMTGTTTATGTSMTGTTTATGTSMT
eukprot:Lankesteria_metandrocarpae@DN8392_c0_g1_i1.p1